MSDTNITKSDDFSFTAWLELRNRYHGAMGELNSALTRLSFDAHRYPEDAFRLRETATATLERCWPALEQVRRAVEDLASWDERARHARLVADLAREDGK